MLKPIDEGCLALVTWASPEYSAFIGIVVSIVGRGKDDGYGGCDRCGSRHNWWKTDKYFESCECSLLRIDGYEPEEQREEEGVEEVSE